MHWEANAKESDDVGAIACHLCRAQERADGARVPPVDRATAWRLLISTTSFQFRPDNHAVVTKIIPQPLWHATATCFDRMCND